LCGILLDIRMYPNCIAFHQLLRDVEID
jgi:hypothetical protein